MSRQEDPPGIAFPGGRGPIGTSSLKSTSRVSAISDTTRWETELRVNQKPCNRMDGVS